VSKVLIVGGGTGGHLFPGLAVAEELRRLGTGVSWLGAARGLEATRVPAAGIAIRLLPVTGAVGRSAVAQAGAILRVVPGLVTSLRHLLHERPSVVLSVGGYAALPGALAAATLQLPLVVQEQNALPGVTNRLLAPWSTGIACGFRVTLAAFPSLPAIWTGNPVREAFFRVPPPRIAPLTVLVLGGSQGSAFLNRVVPEALAELGRRRSLPRIVHQAGERWVGEVQQRYATLGVTAEVRGFLEAPAEALAAASLVIARAGALTVSELAAARRAALLVPFAAAAHGHQLHNARALAATGAAEVVEEAEATPARLAATLAALLAAPEALTTRGQAGFALAVPDAARAVARFALERADAGSAEAHR
jgi:UDP-N-acetylglucosamine--N-acetylmuramyl-(pentapeptide) pyrophosphoryl-undecaprenol N-acetylglucosamine transferase